MLSLVLAAVISSIPVDNRVMEFFSNVMRRANIWNGYSEAAAFIVRDTRGDLQCLSWPMTNEYQKQSFVGDIPMNTVAIVHTHPPDRPLPSEKDIADAKTLKMPFFVLTRISITMINPTTGESVPVVNQRGWASAGLNLRCEDQWLAR